MSSIIKYRIDRLYHALENEENHFSSLKVMRTKNGIKILKSNKVYTIRLVKENNCLHWLLKPYKDSYFMVKCKHDPDFTLLINVLKEDS